MQAVQQCPEFGERGGRGQRFADGESGTPGCIGNPAGKTGNGSIGQITKDVFPAGKNRSSPHPKSLPVQRVKRVMNPDGLGTMGIMFLARAGPGRPIF